MSHSSSSPVSGQKSQPPAYSFETSHYDHFQVIYVGGGTLFFTVCNQAMELGPGSVVLLREGGAFRLHTGKDRGYQGICFNAFGESRPELRGQAVAFQADTDMRLLAGMIDRESRIPGAGSREILNSLGWALAWRAIRRARETVTRSDRPDYARYWAGRAKEALDAAVYTPRTARQVLAAFSLSYRQLSRYFSEAEGVSPKQYQIRTRVREAERLLQATRLPVTAIAFELGYPSSQHFATQFLAATGRTPSEYRRQGEAAAKRGRRR
jgi:AraC-like DNA-binding protein